jgi:MFS family permease
MRADPSRNVWKLKFLSWCWGFLLLTGVAVPFFGSKGLTLSEIYVVQGAFALTMSVCEIPTGYFTEIIGRRNALVTAGVLKGLGGTLLAAGDGFWQILAAYILLGIANSFFSGADIALLYDSIDDQEDAKSKAVGDVYFFGYVSIAMATVVGGWLATRSLQHAAWVNAATAWVSLVVAITLVEPKPVGTQASTSLRPSFGAFLRETTSVIRVMATAKGGAGICFLLTMIYLFPVIISQYAFQQRWSNLGVPLAKVSLVVAGLGLFGAFMGRTLPRLKARLRFGHSIVVLLCLPVLAFAGASASALVVVIVSAALMEIVRALVQVTLLDRVNGSLPANRRALGNSILSFGTRLVVFATAPAFGALVEVRGDVTAFLSMSAFYLLVAIAFLVIFLTTNVFKEAPRESRPAH